MRTRRRQINLYLSDHEHRILTEKCRAGRLTHAAFLRSCILNKPVKAPPNRDYHTLYREINAIGNNINQIARAANAGLATPSEIAVLKRQLDQIYTILERG